VRIDLHTHSSCSDGTDTPAGLVRKAAEAGLDVVAITDHDTFAGWEEALAEAERRGIGLVVGAEISSRLATESGAGASVHVLAYLPDPTFPELQHMLERIRNGRATRVPVILERLQALGITISSDDVARHARSATAPGRPHVADALVEAGYAADRNEAFDRWLGEGGPAYVTRYAPEPGEVIRCVVAAGGAPVLAHPHGRASRQALTDAMLAELAGLGLVGLEVDHLDHDEATRRHLRELAGELGLAVLGSSDYHGEGKDHHDLGCCTTDPEELVRLLDRARAIADASGRRTPEPFLPDPTLLER